MNKVNKETLDLIKSFEGLVLKAYEDVVGVWTIGYGHTSMAGPPTVKPGMTLTKSQAEDLLLSDLKKYEKSVNDLVTVDLNDNQYGALTSFTYNLGAGNLKTSTLLKKVNAKDFSGAAKEFQKWNKAGGKVLNGLTRRRAAEAALFQKPVIGSSKPVQPLPDDPGTEGAETPKRSVWAILGDLIMKLIRGRK
jgi:lysozyme